VLLESLRVLLGSLTGDLGKNDESTLEISSVAAGGDIGSDLMVLSSSSRIEDAGTPKFSSSLS